MLRGATGMSQVTTRPRKLPRRDLGRDCGRFSDHEFRIDQDAAYVPVAAFDAVNERLGGHGADLTHRLADSCEAGQMKGRFANVVETDHRDVLGHAQSGFPDSAYSANRRNVVVSEKRGEGNL